jgi:glycosyltransferase involved in cell wall biosynthesis
MLKQILHIFIFKACSRSMYYGIGTYIRELTSSLLKFDNIKITLVSYRSLECREVKVTKESERLQYIDIPCDLIYSANRRNADKKYANAVVCIISSFIPKNDKVIFQMNYIDDVHISRRLKEKYEYPIISIVHFTQYQQLFNGNKLKLKDLNIDNPSNNYEFTLSTEKEYYSASDHIISVTNYMKEFLIEFFKINPGKISVVPNGIKYERFKMCSENEKLLIRKNLGFRNDDIIILFSGRVDVCKGVTYLFQAFQEACKKRDNLKLILLGSGNFQEFQPLIKSDFGKIIFTGFLKKDQVDQFYKIADIGIVPSLYDHCPYSVLEMMANRIPLIMSRIDGLNEMLDDSECLFINPLIDFDGEIKFESDKLSDLIIKLSDDECLRKKLSDASYIKIKEKFSSSFMSDSMGMIFASLTEKYQSN